jgi:hypothetical protein
VRSDDGQAHRLSGQDTPARAVLAVHADRVAAEEQVNASVRAQQRARQHEENHAASRERDRRLPGARREPDRQQRLAVGRLLLDAESFEQLVEAHTLDVAPRAPYPTSTYRHPAPVVASVSGVSHTSPAQIRHQLLAYRYVSHHWAALVASLP